MSNQDVQVFFPAAGFGRRVGQPEAKEMLPDPVTGEPLIAYWLNWAQSKGFRAHVVSRKEKKNLNTYLQTSWPGVQLHVIDPSREWPESLLRVRNAWGLRNLMILPDTRFEPLSAIDVMLSEVATNARVVFGVFRENEHQAWGVIRKDMRGVWWGCEKPKEKFLRRDVWVWGVIAFDITSGVEVFQKLLQSTLSHEWYRISTNVRLVEIEVFRDLTRGDRLA